MVRWLCLLLAGCSFSVPSSPAAEQACFDWLEARRQHAIACGTDPAEAAEIFNRATKELCDTVLWADLDKVYNECIPDALNGPCGARAKCMGF